MLTLPPIRNEFRVFAKGSAYEFTLIFDRYHARSDKRTFAIITSDEEVAVDTITNDFVQKKAEAEASDLWKDLYFKVKNVSMAEAADHPGGKYNVKYARERYPKKV